MAHVIACPRTRVEKLAHILPAKYVEALEQNQLLSSCCRHPENHEIEARYSNEEEKIPDIYILYCTCGRKHIRFCVGENDTRPFWEAR